jgi:hypothetical protein
LQHTASSSQHLATMSATAQNNEIKPGEETANSMSTNSKSNSASKKAGTRYL